MFNSFNFKLLSSFQISFTYWQTIMLVISLGFSLGCCILLIILKFTNLQTFVSKSSKRIFKRPMLGDNFNSDVFMLSTS